jgi:hypothetical protein
MLRRLAWVWLSVVTVAATGQLVSAADDVVGETGYYPLKKGTEWEYTVNGGSQLLVKVVKHELKGTAMTARLETTVDGKIVLTENLAVAKDAVLRAAANDNLPSKPTIVLKLPPKAGDKWRIDADVDREKLEGELTCEAIAEKIKVPAGEFTAVKVGGTFITTAVSGEKQENAFQAWYAEGTGPVKIILKTQGSEHILELKKYTAGK